MSSIASPFVQSAGESISRDRAVDHVTTYLPQIATGRMIGGELYLLYVES